MVTVTTEREQGDASRLYERGAMTVEAAAEFMGLGRTFLYGAMERGELRYIKAGKRRLIPRQAAVDYLASLGGAGR